MISLRILSGLTALLVAAPLVRASNISFTGTFVSDSDLQFFTFTLASPTAGVALRTWSYAGGTNAAGNLIAAGGFEPYLNLYDSSGNQMNPGFSGPCTIPPTGNPVADLLPDPTSGACADVYYPTTESFPGGIWAAGTYTVVLSTFANPGVGPTLSDGFLAPLQGLPADFTCQVGAPGGQGNPPTIPVDQPFCDEWAPGTQRTGAWALDFLNVDSAIEASNVPEPGALPLTLVLLAGLCFVAKRSGSLKRSL